MATAKKIITKAVRAKKATTSANEMKIYSMQGKEVGTIALPKEIFGMPWRNDLVHQVTTAMQANARQNRASTKDRSEVSGGGKKPWKQKGTGQARHGSIRSPLWRHGGVTFGPRSERDYSEKINRKMRIGALVSVLSRKVKDGEVILVDQFLFAAPKTKDALNVLAALSKGAKVDLLSSKGSKFIALASYNQNAIKSFNNLQCVETGEIRNLNPVTLLTHKYLIIENPETAFAVFLVRVKAA